MTEQTKVTGPLVETAAGQTLAQKFALILNGSKSYNPPNISNNARDSTTVTVTGAVLGDFALASFSLDAQGIVISSYVSAADTVTVIFQNHTGSPVDLGAGTLRAKVIKIAF